jgi:hypothetical protein
MAAAAVASTEVVVATAEADTGKSLRQRKTS